MKRTFQEYGFEIKEFLLGTLGNIKYAQWLHPFESEKIITTDQIQFFAQFIEEGDFLVDIGAHTGDTTVPMAVATGKNGLVLALEPNPYVFKILQENAKLNPDFGKISALPFAATEEEGKFTFNYSDASFCNGGYLEKIKNRKHNHKYELQVEGINLQSYLLSKMQNDLSRLSLVKVDAEGYDKEILKTLPNILEQFHPTLLVECYKRLDREERKELYQIITEQGYRLYKIDEFEASTQYVLLDEESMNNERHFEMLAVHHSKKKLITKLNLAE